MQKRRYEILLPGTNNDGQPINSKKFRQTREELLAKMTVHRKQQTSTGRKARAMQMIKIQIADKADSSRAMMEMARRGRIDCYPNEVYIVPEPALELLKAMGVNYRELERGGIDYAEKTLRDTIAAHEQRRAADKLRKVPADA